MIKRNACIVVTGANGLVGSAVVEHLRKEMFTCVIAQTRKDVDLLDTQRTYAWFDMVQPQFVFHAAATVYGLGGNMANQGKSIYENTLINSNVIEACRMASVQKMTVMGTNAIYPASARIPYQESDIFNGRPHAGEFAYGHAKRHMLAMLEAYKESYGLEYSYIVSGNIYGPRDRFDPVSGHVIPSLIRKFADAKRTMGTVEIWGNGTAKRDFLYSKDLARIVQLLMSPDIKSGAINVGFGEAVSLGDVVARLCDISGVRADRVRFDPSKPVGRMRTECDLSRLHALGFIPRYTLDEGLRETWDWYLS